MSGIKVRVIKMSGRPSLVVEWRDPLSGKLKRKATGEKDRRKAERFAARLEKLLSDGEYHSTSVRWEEFRRLYESAHDERWAVKTKARVATVLDSVEKHLAPRFVRAIDSAAVMKFAAAMKEAGGAPAGIAAALRHLKAALRWGHRKSLVARVPDIEMPAGSIKAGGRAISAEEYERMLDATPKALAEMKSRADPDAADVESWRDLLRCLWTTGLRIGEAMKLHWTDDSDITPDLSGKFPMFSISERASKNGKDQRFPMAPEAFQWLSRTPEQDREGFVVNPTSGGLRVGYGHAVKVVSMIGKRAGVVVERDEKGAAVYASAHDLRRSCATRWAAKVTPGVLQSLMRHSSPTTTAKFYTDRSGEPIAAAVWEALGQSTPAAPATIVSTITK